MFRKIPVSVFFLVYIGFSFIFHQAPLLSWLNKFTDFSAISGVSAFLFIQLLSFLLWIIILTPFFIISIKLGKLIAVILLILNATALFWMTQSWCCHDQGSYRQPIFYGLLGSFRFSER